MNKPNLVYRALSHLLMYPDDAMRKALPEVRDILREERRLSEPTRRALLGFAEDLQAGDVCACSYRKRTQLHLCYVTFVIRPITQ